MPTFYPTTFEKGNNYGEELFFYALEKCHNLNGYHIFHSLSILTHLYQKSGEADFVIAGPNGVLIVEVKGATSIKIDGSTWEFINSNQAYKKGSPFKQAEQNMYSLIEGFNKKYNHHIAGFFGYCVVFPNLEFNHETVEYSKDIIIDKSDMSRICERVQEIMQYFKDKNRVDANKSLYPNVVNDLVQYFRGKFSLMETSRSYCDRTLSIIETASDEQIKVMEGMANINQIMVNGLAGTGKTLLAKRIAKIKSNKGKKVLFICFNKILALDIKAELSRFSRDIDIMTFDGLVSHVLRTSGTDLDNASDFNDRRKKAEDLLSFDPTILGKYDTIVLDEAQDILTGNSFKILEFLLKDGFEKGNWYIFYDDQVQDALFGKSELRSILERLRSISRNEPYQLNENFRNPKYIVDKTGEFTKLPIPKCNIPSSEVNLEVLYYHREGDIFKQILGSLRHLFIGLKIKPNQVIIMVPKESQIELVMNQTQAVRQEIDIFNEFVDLRKISERSDLNTDFVLDQNQTPVSTIHAFKGMESEYVILAGLDSLDDNARTLLYIGMTRTKVKTYLICKENLANIIRKEILK